MLLTVACSTCGFQLWRPISSLRSSQLGLYSDERFPGRSILSLNEHFDHFDEVPLNVLWEFMVDLKNSMAAIKKATGAPRVNTAILGNQEGHVHAHLVPRQPDAEPRPDKAPWEDTRDKGPLDVIEEGRITRSIQEALMAIDGVATPYPIPSNADLQLRQKEREEARSTSHDETLFGDLWGEFSDLDDELRTLGH